MKMAALTLKIKIVDLDLIKTMTFDPKSTIVNACDQINKKLQDTSAHKKFNIKDYGLFLTDDDPKKGVWLEPGRSLDFYVLRDNAILEFKTKMRTLRVRMLDGTIKTVFIDDSQPVANLMVVICTKIGITNHDEYSLVREQDDKFDKENINSTYSSGTLTIKRNKDRDKPIDSKMEQLKKKLKTDDDLNWVDQSKTLREQGIDDDETLLLRRKFFFSDQNIDSRDPVQLNLLYVQTRDAIIQGTHPVTLDQAAQFAGIQCQIQYGNYDETKHKPGFIELKEFLPRDYIKIKNIEKRIFVEHSRYTGLSDLDSKVKYVQLARSLKTYGVTFFLVKEKMQGKNKLVPRILGVTKDSVLRLDEQTKNILETWPLTSVKRWAASPNSFTLDFGDYKQSYFSVQTSEGEQIAQLIAGYIDIILKRKKAKDHFGIDGDEGSTMVEDSVSPYKATILQHQSSNKPTVPHVGSIAMPAVMRLPQQEPPPIYQGSVPETRVTTIKGKVNIGYAGTPQPKQPEVMNTDLTDGQHALLGVIEAAKEAVKQAEKTLETKIEIPDLGEDNSSLKWKQVQLDVKKQNVASQLHAINGATAQIITYTAVPLEEQNLPQIGAALATITSNLPELSKDTKFIAALMNDDERETDLIDAARRLCRAVEDLLKGVEPNSVKPRMDVLKSASKIGETTQQILAEICDVDEFDRETYDILMKIAKSVATAAASLLLKAKDLVNQLSEHNPEAKNRIISSAKQCALASHQLAACTKVVAPTIQNTTCQKQLTDTCKEVSRMVDGVVAECSNVEEDIKIDGLKEAAAQVTRILKELLDQVNDISSMKKPRKKEEPVDAILEATDKLFSSSGDPNEMVKQARVLAQATTQLINDIKGEAKSKVDSSAKNRLLAAANVLADAFSNLIEAAKGCKSNPNDSSSQAALKQAAEDLRIATNNAAPSAIKNKQVKDLYISAKHCTQVATQNIAAIHGATGQYTDNSLEEDLKRSSAQVSDMIPQVVEGMINLVPENRTTQLDFIKICEKFVGPAQELATISRSAVGIVKSESSAIQLANSSNNLNDAVSLMKTEINKSEKICERSNELDEAIKDVKSLINQVDEFKREANRAQLRPLTGESSEQCITKMNSQCQAVNQAMSEFLSAGSQGNEQNIIDAARELSSKLRNLLQSVRSVASTTNDNDLQMRILNNTKSVLVKSIVLFEETKWVLSGTLSNAEKSQRLSSVSQHVQHALSSCVYCLPGQQDIDECVRSIIELSEKYIEQHLPPYTNRPYGELHTSLQSAANRLLDQAANILSQYKDQSLLVQTAKQYSNAYKELYNAGIKVASATANTNTLSSSSPSRIISALKQVASCSSKLLIASKNTASDPNNSLAFNSLNLACKAVLDSVNDLLSQCVSLDNFSIVECDAALRKIQTYRKLLDNVVQPINNTSYFSCVEQVTRLSTKLTENLSSLNQSLNNSKFTNENQKFVDDLKKSVSNICDLLEATAHSAYLIAATDPTSVPGKPALVNLDEMQNASDHIEQACKQLTSHSYDKAEIFNAATVIAKHTSELINIGRYVLSKINNNKASKDQFYQLNKEVANATAALVKEIKILDQEKTSETSRQACNQATVKLMNSINNLIAFATYSEFAAVPAKLSSKAKDAQLPVIENGKTLADQSIELLNLIKQQLNSEYANTNQLFINQAKNINITCKRLIEIVRDASPGQKDCDKAIETLTYCIREIDQASLNLINQNHISFNENSSSILACKEKLCNLAKELNKKINQVRSAGQSETENLGHSVNRFISYFEPLTQTSIECAKNMISSSKNQMLLLNQVKAICENALHLMYSVKQCAGNPNSAQLHIEINDASNSLINSLAELINSLEVSASIEGQVNVLIDTISQSKRKLEDHFNYSNGQIVPVDATEKNFSEHQAKLINSAKELAKIAQDIVVKCNSTKPSSQQLTNLTAGLSRCYDKISNESADVISSTGNLETSNNIKIHVQNLGNSCIDLTKWAGECQTAVSTGGSIDTLVQQSITKAGKRVNENVNYILAALQAGTKGTQVCLNAVSTIQGIIGDLNTTIMFATAGTLNPEHEDEEFCIHRDAIIRAAQNSVEDTKALVSSTAASQEQLAIAAQNSVDTIKQLADVVKQGAASFGSANSEAQVLLLNSVKDVAAALSDMILATKSAAGKDPNDVSMGQMKESAKVFVENVTSLLKTVKAVEDEHLRGTRALEATIEAIDQELRSFDSENVPKRKATPEELVNATKPITLATSKAVAAGNSTKQEDVIVAANMGRKAITDLLITVKQAAWSTDQLDDRRQVLDIGRECAVQYSKLLDIVHTLVSRPIGSSLGMSSQISSQDRQLMIDISRNIAATITRIATCAEHLKGSDWINPSDPTVIAETELLGASSSIEAAAEKLASLRPRRTSVKLPDEDMNFDEMILNAAKCITAATAALLKAASAAQRELNAIFGSTKPAFHNELDGQWSNGLISAARHVAAATHSLVEAANSLVQGNSSEEKLISAAKQVASSTASLLVACKVKSGTDSTAMQRLQHAGNSVKKATEMLVKSAQQAKDIADEEDEQSIVISKRKVPGIAQEIVAREEIIKKEKELEEAREKLALIHKSKYRKPEHASNFENGYN